MKNMTLEQMAKACSGTLFAGEHDQEQTAAGVVIDSRQVRPGYVFVAIPGERVDGHDFSPQVFAQGAFAVISEKELEAPAGPYILVASTKTALANLAAHYRASLDIPVVGITGSVGKTSTKEMISAVLSQKYKVHKTAGNFNNEIGLPLTVFQITEEAQVAVLEMGISEFGEMTRLAKVARPNIAVITNIGICHLENLKTRDGILQAKTEMFDHLAEHATVVLNGDDDKLCTVERVQGNPPVFYGMGEDKPQAAVYDKKSVFATEVENLGLEGVRFLLHLPQGAYPLQTFIPGVHNVYNACAAAAVGLALGLTQEEICRGIESAQTIAGRTNLIHAKDYLVIDDCYNANPVSMKAAIDVLVQAKGRKIAVLGDMGELGENEEKLHYEVGTYLAKSKVDLLFTSGELCRHLKRGVTDHPHTVICRQFDSRDELLEKVKETIQQGDTILVKASHFMGYQDIVKALI